MSLSQHFLERARPLSGGFAIIRPRHHEALDTPRRLVLIAQFGTLPGSAIDLVAWLLAIRLASPVRSLATLRGGRYL